VTWPYLSTEEIEGKAVEAADDGLLHIQAEGVESSHSGEEQPWPTRTEHVDVECLAFPLSHFHLSKTKCRILKTMVFLFLVGRHAHEQGFKDESSVTRIRARRQESRRSSAPEEAGTQGSATRGILLSL
jgi:hypothetical protein